MTKRASRARVNFRASRRAFPAARPAILASVCVVVIGGLTTAATPAEAKTCGFEWAVPGQYQVSGDFRGQMDSVTARLTTDCRVTIGLPGVFTGGQVTLAGDCLVFSFRVEGEQRSFEAQWCGGYGLVPWEGRNVRATVARVEAPSVGPETR